MSDLYTSQVHLKRLLAGQATPAFTPAPETTLKVLDPELFPGMGAVNEDEHGRLQCPVRGCGEWHHILGHHLTRKHKAIGGADAVKQALGIAGSQSLTSESAKAAIRAKTARAVRVARESSPVTPNPRSAAGRKKSFGARNRADTCPAQLQVRISALHKKLGRSPSSLDFVREYGRGCLWSVTNVFGSWENAKRIVGLPPVSKWGVRPTRNDVVAALGEYARINGDLPKASEASCPERVPRIPEYRTILRALDVDTWDAAMRTVVESLDIVSARYGRPTKMA